MQTSSRVNAMNAACSAEARVRRRAISEMEIASLRSQRRI